mgnify:CR=1 FL=1
MSKNLLEKPSFIFKIDDLLFERQTVGKPNFISIYYLEYGDSHEDQADVAIHVARRDKVAYTGFGHMELFSSVTPKFTFPYEDKIVILEVADNRSHQSICKYCDKISQEVSRKGVTLHNFASLSLLEKLK